MVHEVLMALQGCKNILFNWADADGGFQASRLNVVGRSTKLNPPF